ncbi:outer membrane lipoprotein-sorting protein [Pseudomonas sp. WN033]|nr:outer membrane lipoprotein-sorting protein [Pseudomonas sp. WN033]
MIKQFGIIMLAAVVAGQAQAKVDPLQAERLGRDLTPLGAERAGNAAGTIPEWTGGVTPPAHYRPGMHHPDPYASDAELYRVNASNLAQYANQLPEGLSDLLQRHPDYYMRVYPTRRSASNPQRIYDATKRNAVNAELIANGNGITGAAAGIPFPIPQSGIEVIWNHILHYKGDQNHFITNQAVVINGRSNLIRRDRQIYYVYGREGMTPDQLDNTLLYYKYVVTAPARLSGTALVVQDPLDQVLTTRRAWRYSPDNRRVRRLPSLAYDSIQPDTSGLATADVVDTYNGAPDRYEWSLLGKREMLVPYNSYAVHQKGIPYDRIVQERTLNPELLRYELHRVWVIDATLRAGMSHVYQQRRFYVDEDSWQILAVDLRDRSGELVGLQESHPINYYDVPMVGSTVETLYHLKTGNYFVDGLNNNEPMYDFNAQLSPHEFSAQALRRSGN